MATYVIYGLYFAAMRSPYHLKPPRQKIEEKIGYAIGQSSLGLILVACCELGVLAILVGQSKKVLITDMKNKYPNTHALPGEWDAMAILKKVVTFIDTPFAELDLPLYMKGTPFQKRIWQAVQQIPYGKTATYAEIARLAGKPRAMRAVGSTCTHNKLFYAVPCHRVVHSDGVKRLGERRKFLLEREAKHIPGRHIARDK